MKETTSATILFADLMNSTIHNVTYPDAEIRVKVDVGVGTSGCEAKRGNV